MEAHPDFRDLLALFNAEDVDYVIVGAFALAFHGVPRATGDMDLLVKPDRTNARRILAALKKFGFGSVGLKLADFEKPERVVQLGYPPVRIDITTSITGVSWDEAAAGRAAGTLADVSVHFLGRAQFVANKRATGRLKDLADLEALGEELPRGRRARRRRKG